MEVAVILLLFFIFGVSNIFCFIIGAKVGQTVSNGKDIELPNLNPVDMVRSHQERKAAKEEQSRLDTLMENINSYNGTSFGQKDLPGR